MINAVPFLHSGDSRNNYSFECQHYVKVDGNIAVAHLRRSKNHQSISICQLYDFGCAYSKSNRISSHSPSLSTWYLWTAVVIVSPVFRYSICLSEIVYNALDFGALDTLPEALSFPKR